MTEAGVSHDKQRLVRAKTLQLESETTNEQAGKTEHRRKAELCTQLRRAHLGSCPPPRSARCAPLLRPLCQALAAAPRP